METFLFWAIGKNVSKSMRFRSKTDLCGRGLRKCKSMFWWPQINHYHFQASFEYRSPI